MSLSPFYVPVYITTHLFSAAGMQPTLHSRRQCVTAYICYGTSRYRSNPQSISALEPSGRSVTHVLGESGRLAGSQSAYQRGPHSVRLLCSVHGHYRICSDCICHTASIDPSVLATSNGHSGKDLKLGSTDDGSSGAGKAAGVYPSMVVLAMMLAGVTTIMRAISR